MTPAPNILVAAGITGNLTPPLLVPLEKRPRIDGYMWEGGASYAEAVPDGGRRDSARRLAAGASGRGS